MGCVLASLAMVLMLEFIVLLFMSFSKRTVAYDYITRILILLKSVIVYRITKHVIPDVTIY